MLEFRSQHQKFQEYSDTAIDWFIRSTKFKYGSPEWKICRLKRQIYMREAIKHLEEAMKWTT